MIENQKIMSGGGSPLQIIVGDCRETLRGIPDASVQLCVTSPPYFGLRDYGHGDQIGLEKTPAEYVAQLVAVFREVRRILKSDGTLWLNLGDSYAGGGNGGGGSFAKDGPRMTQMIGADKNVPARKGSRNVTVKSKRIERGAGRWGGGDIAAPVFKAKDLLGIPWRVAFALQADGWWLRQWCPWIKRNPMPESVSIRPTTACETLFMLTKSADCFYDASAVKLTAKYADDDRKGRAQENHKSMPTAQRNGLRPRKETDCARKQDQVDNHKYGGFNDRCAENGGTGASRSRRNSDWFFESLDGFQGLLGDDEGEPLAFIINTHPYKEAHFATFPPRLVKPCVLSGSRPGDTVLDPFGGSGTTAQVALELGRKAIVCELNPEYIPLIKRRTNVTPGLHLAVSQDLKT